MNNAKQHWEILQKLETDLANRVREFMVIGEDGDGLLVITEDGLGYGFGFGKNCQIWNEWNRTAIKPTPLDVTGLVQMAKGHDYILLLNRRGEIYSMGWNDCGQLGLGTQKTYFSPQLIPIGCKFISIRCGEWHSLALTEDGKCWAWGSNYSGQLGVPSSINFFCSSPRQISELNSHRIVAVECGGCHSLALTNRGEVYGWGANCGGQLGDGSRSLSKHTPTQIFTPSPVKSMAAGNDYTLLLTQTGEVWACGWNRFGQLGLPTTTVFSVRLVKVAGLPLISQIASHPATNLSIAISSDHGLQSCFVWGQLVNGKLEKKYISISIPLKLPLDYSTVDSPLSHFSPHHSTPHSIQVPETPLSRLSARMSRMFDNPEISDVQFVVEQRTIHAHRIILRYSSDYFARMFSERWLAPVDPVNSIVKVTISDYSYEAFYAFLRFLYTDSLKVYLDLLPELFELASHYLVPDLQQLCLSRMRSSLIPTTCCLYYPLTIRHALSELADFRQELLQFASTRMSIIAHTATYHAMEPNLRANLIKTVNISSKLLKK